MNARVFRTSFCIFLACTAASACSPNVPPGYNGQTTYSVAQTGGKYILISQHCYGDSTDFNAVKNLDVDTIHTTLKSTSNPSWGLAALYEDTVVDLLSDNCQNDPGAISASNFTDSTASAVDFIWFSGHGYGIPPTPKSPLGALALYNFQPSPGCNITDQFSCFYVGDSGLPYNTGQNNKLKWVFAFSSYGANPNLNSWTGAFDSQPFAAGTGLHGFYAFEGEPSDNYGVAAATQFLNDEVMSVNTANPLTIDSAWIHAAQANHRAGDYGFFVLKSAEQDVLSGTPPGYNAPVTTNSRWSASNPVDYYNARTGGVFTPPLTNIGSATPGPYVPTALNPESWTDGYLASQADAREPGAAKYYQNANQYRIVGKSYQASHYEANGAVIIASNFSTIPLNYTQNDAYNFAISQIKANGGLPPDAVLHEVDTHYRHDPSGAVVTGYGFIWRHQNGLVGGDSIEAVVDNQQRSVCIAHDHCNGCIDWQTVFDMRVNYLYRLWRSMGAARAPSNALSSRQALSIATTQAKLKGTIATLGTPLGYVYGYWSPPFYATDNTAYPMYQFVYSSGAAVSVDAASGEVLGVASSP